MMKHVRLTLVTGVLLLTMLRIASWGQEAGFTDWMTSGAYQAFVELKLRDEFYPVKVEARVTADDVLYRAQFEPFPRPPFSLDTRHGISEGAFTSRSREREAGGYRLIWLQRVVDQQGRPRYQATWVKGNGPPALAQPAPGTAGSPVASRPGGIPPTRPTPAPGAGPVARSEFTFTVTYRVKGTAGSVLLSFRDQLGGVVQMSSRLPWALTFDARDGTFLRVSAQNESVEGSVTCAIEVDGVMRTTSTSTGAYVLAECSNMAERH